MKQDNIAQTLLKVGFTSILLGYLLVWLPQPVAGLSFIGLEMGEWVKFLPQVRSGEIVPGRNLFYLPPITLGLMLGLWTVGWPNKNWRTWGMRGLAILVALLAFPSIEAILDEGIDQWLLRFLLILLVVATALGVSLLESWPTSRAKTISWIIIIALGLAGAILPTWAFLAIRPAVIELVNSVVKIGPGVWLNLFGSMFVVGVALYYLESRRKMNEVVDS